VSVGAFTGEGRRDVTATVSAPGYEPASVEVTPLGGEAKHYEVRLKPLPGTKASVRVAAHFSGGKPFSGILNLEAAHVSTDSEWNIPLEFEAGVCMGVISLPVGTYETRLTGAGPDTMYWKPASDTTRRTVSLGGDSGGDSTWDFELQGGGVLLSVNTEQGVDLRAFTITVAGPRAQGLISTWLLPRPLQQTSGGTEFWMPPGKARVGIVRFGYRTRAREVVVPKDGSSVSVEITLPRVR
jgi:hypothetical protein